MSIVQDPRRLPACLAVILSISLAASAGTPAQETRLDAGKAAAVELSRIRIDNFGRVSANYYRGAQPYDSDYSDLAALGIKAIINLTSVDGSADEQTRVKASGMRYFHIPMSTRIPPTSAQIAEFLGVVTTSANQPAYIHCVGGRHRTGVMTAIYRMNEDGWTSDRAFKEMKQYKFGADFLHPEFKRFVYAYQPHPLASVSGGVTEAARQQQYFSSQVASFRPEAGTNH